MTFEFMAISAVSVLATAVLAFLTFSKQVDLRPVPVRRTDMRNLRDRRNRR